jgi:hypothetical protein
MIRVSTVLIVELCGSAHCPSGVFGGVIVTQDFLQTLGIQNNKSMQGTVTAIYDIGCFVGAIAAFYIGGMLSSGLVCSNITI